MIVSVLLRSFRYFDSQCHETLGTYPCHVQRTHQEMERQPNVAYHHCDNETKGQDCNERVHEKLNL
jgi:hypothetical protein